MLMAMADDGSRVKFHGPNRRPFLPPSKDVEGASSILGYPNNHYLSALAIARMATTTFHSRRSSSTIHLPTLVILLFCSPQHFSEEAFAVAAPKDTIRKTESIRDGETLLSPNGQFSLGFFSPANSSHFRRYLGIWYPFAEEIVVWVANRRNPIPDTTGVLTLTANGTLVLSHGKSNTTAWTSATTNSTVSAANPIARLSDSGNFIVTADGSSSGSVTWQSFDHPTDTMLPGMKLGGNLRTGKKWSLLSWKSPDDPSPGDYLLEMNIHGNSYEVYEKRSDTGVIKYRPGRWNGIYYSGSQEQPEYVDILFNQLFVSDEDEAYIYYEVKNASTVARLLINSTSRIQFTVWVEQTRNWAPLILSPVDDCTAYGACGPNGVCSDGGMPRVCECYDGYVPVEPKLWKVKEYSKGCRREKGELCRAGEGFNAVERMKIPDTMNATIDYGKSLDQCGELCLGNCNCTAYAAANLSSGRNGTGCMMWEGDLIDSRRFTANGQQLFLRAAASDLFAPDGSNQEQRKRNLTAVAIAAPLGMASMAALLGALIWRKRKKDRRRKKGKMINGIVNGTKILDGELQSFDLAVIASMTDNFADHNKIGEGGFGSVYKGRIENGQEVAVKRLSEVSAQGLNEFLNEVVLIGKLQHRNLVRLLGCCITEEERILVYEYMRNQSLDTFIFGKASRTILDWRKRVNIIMGIARGLLYLHHDSRLKIIHRDLKAGNILLDEEMNPRISDFGTARLFNSNQSKERTRRVVGTYGYMSPEYALDGVYSVKSDVFSFGVLVLEIISGRKNRVLYVQSEDLNQLALAWRLWREKRALELVDDALVSTCLEAEFLRCMHIALLCIQEHADDRPTMSTVVFMLSNENSPLPEPKRPGFCRTDNAARNELQSELESCHSINNVTITNVQGR